MPKTKFFKASWFWGRETESWLKKLCIGYTLNFPCGKSRIGNVLADIDKNLNPHIVADLWNPKLHFKPSQFKTVICDPPFSFWALNKIYSWFPSICCLATKRLIFRAPLVQLTPPKMQKKWIREYYIIVRQDRMHLNMFHVFTNPNQQLNRER